MQKFLQTRYGKDIICFLTVVVLFSTNLSNVHSSVYIAAGALISFVPRVIMIWRKVNVSESTEKTRAAIQFCIFLFLFIWSIDFMGKSQSIEVICLLTGATFYNLVLWTALHKSEKENASEVSIPSTQ